MRVAGWIVAGMIASVLGAPGGAPPDSTWVDHYRAAMAARQSGDLTGARGQLLRTRDLLGETPGLSFQLARIAARLGDREGALTGLGRYAASGLTRDVAGDSDFVALRGDTAFEARAARIRDNARPLGRASVTHTFTDAALLTEDVAWDARARRYLVTSIVRGEVLEVRADGTERTFAVSPHAARWGLMAAGIDARRRWLWVSEVASPTCTGWSPADSGRSGLLAFALGDGRLVRHLDTPRDGRGHVVGDLCVSPAGDVYATDGSTGAVYHVRPGRDSLETLAPVGTFQNPQTPALAPDGRTLLVADYGRGIARLDLASGEVRWLAFEPGIALQGIDGLYVLPGALIAVQNGVNPRRVMRFTLDPTGARVIRGEALASGSARLGEPTHGVRVGDAFVFLAGTGWDRVGADERMVSRPGDPAPMLMSVPLRAGR
jgi:hypothetical protein